MLKKNEKLRCVKLKVSIKGKDKIILNEIDLSCYESEFLTIIGKNGEGKTTLALSLTKLLNPTIYQIEGQIFFNNTDILSMNEEQLTKFRKEKVGYILQNPFSSFNPTLKLKNQLNELSKFKNVPFEYFLTLMDELELKNHNQILDKYPFQLSGGMLQKLSIIIVLASNPEVIIADEPTSALDKPIANQLIKILQVYVKKINGILIFITQDISIAEKFSDRVAFLHNGKLIQSHGNIFDLIDNIDLKVILNSYKKLKI